MDRILWKMRLNQSNRAWTELQEPDPEKHKPEPEQQEPEPEQQTELKIQRAKAERESYTIYARFAPCSYESACYFKKNTNKDYSSRNTYHKYCNNVIIFLFDYRNIIYNVCKNILKLKYKDIKK